MLFTVVVFFFACMMPFKLLTLWFVASPYEVMDVISGETYYNLLYFARIMFYTNSAINPVLYNIMSSKFRDGFKKIFQNVTCKKHRNRHIDEITDDLDFSSAKLRFRNVSVPKVSSFDIFGSTEENPKNETVSIKESSKKKFYAKGGDEQNCSNKNNERKGEGNTEDDVAAESILLIEEKQYRLIQAKGRFNI